MHVHLPNNDAHVMVTLIATYPVQLSADDWPSCRSYVEVMKRISYDFTPLIIAYTVAVSISKKVYG
jgi:hypothetical protein